MHMLLINSKTEMGGRESRTEKNKPSRGRARDYLHSCLQFSQSSAPARRSLFLNNAFQQRVRKGSIRPPYDLATGKAGRGNNRLPHYSGRADCGEHTRGKPGPGLGSKAKSHPRKPRGHGSRGAEDPARGGGGAKDRRRASNESGAQLLRSLRTRTRGNRGVGRPGGSGRTRLGALVPCMPEVPPAS